jgi:hypothetical protein
MERIQIFLPSILSLIIIAGASLTHMIWFIRNHADNYKSEEWVQQNLWKALSITISEELCTIAGGGLFIFLPLIIFFSKMTSVVLLWVAISAGLYTFLVYYLKMVILPRRITSPATSKTKLSVGWIVVNLFIWMMALLFSFLAGYYGILYQSVWIAIFFLFVMNNLALVPLFLCVMYMICFIQIEKISWFMYKRRMMSQQEKQNN